MNQLAANSSGTGSSIIERIENDIHRMRRTIHLLISVGIVFCICWLPLNILNTVSIQKNMQYVLLEGFNLKIYIISVILKHEYHLSNSIKVFFPRIIFGVSQSPLDIWNKWMLESGWTGFSFKYNILRKFRSQEIQAYIKLIKGSSNI